MQIVIEISDHLYKCLQKRIELNVSSETDQIIAKGKPLPEHHGRLIDADAIEYTHAIARCLDDGHNWNELCVTENELYDTPTIIEADTAESEEE